MHVPLPPAIPELPIWLEEKAPIVFPTLLAINGLKLAVIFGAWAENPIPGLLGLVSCALS